MIFIAFTLSTFFLTNFAVQRSAKRYADSTKHYSGVAKQNGQAEQVSNSRNKLHQTTYVPFSRSLYLKNQKTAICHEVAKLHKSHLNNLINIAMLSSKKLP